MQRDKYVFASIPRVQVKSLVIIVDLRTESGFDNDTLLLELIPFYCKKSRETSEFNDDLSLG